MMCFATFLTNGKFMQTADFWHNLDGFGLRCELCPRQCVLSDGEIGDCLARENHGGILFAAAFGKVVSLALDPVEKKPLFHFHPGEMIFSVGGYGCNLHCAFCQNWEISQQIVKPRASQDFSPAQIIAEAKSRRARLIAYTYNEPFINFEFLFAVCTEAKNAGLKNVLVTNGYCQPEPLEKLLPLLDALNIDLKSFDDNFYRRHCGGAVGPVLRTIARAAQTTHVEITTLIIAGENDDSKLLAEQRDWLAENCGENIPLHLSAYFPCYRFDRPKTTTAALIKTAEIFRERLKYVYLGNVAEPQNTVCVHCGNLLITRNGYRTEIVGLRDNACANCGKIAPIILA